MLIAYIDAETCSELDLTEVGAYRYFDHPTTALRLLCYRVVSQGGVLLDHGTLLHFPEKWPAMLEEAFKFGLVYAHNAQFERLLFDALCPAWLPTPSFNQWRCTAALARCAGLPGALDDAAEALKLEHRKLDTAIMKKAARPGDLTREEWSVLETYCARDTLLCAEIHGTLGDMDDNDLYTYQMNEHVNDRGVRIDRAAVNAVRKAIPYTFERLNNLLPTLTGGTVEKGTQVQRMKKWVEDRLGIFLASLDKDAINTLLERDIPDDVRKVLEIRTALARSSISKYESMAQHVQRDHRLRGMFIFAGAAQTGRFSSTDPQLHNLVRTSPPDAAHILEWLVNSDPRALDLVYGDDAIKLVSQLIRPCLIPAPGKVYVLADYSGVEARKLPWLANTPDSLRSLDKFRGGDPYKDDARAVFNLSSNIDVDDSQRQVGKVVRLACGFGGGGPALMNMSKGYGIRLTEERAYELADAWHAANRWARDFGDRLYQTALDAMASPVGRVHQVPDSPIWYARMTLPRGIDVLLCCLPSGRVLHYHNVRLNGRLIESWRPRFKNHEVLRTTVFAENVTSASCNDLLRHGMMEVHATDWPLVAHVHDEFILEIAEQPGIVQSVREVLERVPPWAVGFPLEVKPKIAHRYGK